MIVYVVFKGMDNFGFFVSDVYGFDDVEVVNVSVIVLWVWFIVVLGVGFIVDKVGGFWVIVVCFVLMIFGNGFVVMGFFDLMVFWMFFIMVIVVGVVVFGIWGIYFVIFDDVGVLVLLMGIVVGLVSVVGYILDIFMGLFNGYLIDIYLGVLGY